MGKSGKFSEPAQPAGAASERLYPSWAPASGEAALRLPHGAARFDPSNAASANGHVVPIHRPTMLAGYWRFLMAGLRHHEQTGAIVPSQRFLVDRMIRPVPADYTGQVLELGAGTGSLTRRLAMTRPRARITAVEINPALADLLRRSLVADKLDDRIQVVGDSAERLLASLRHSKQKPDFVISGIPLGNLDKAQVMALMEGIHGALPKGGMYIQFQHSLLDRKKIRSCFSRLRTVPVLLNFPPAFVYYARK